VEAKLLLMKPTERRARGDFKAWINEVMLTANGSETNLSKMEGVVNIYISDFALAE